MTSIQQSAGPFSSEPASTPDELLRPFRRCLHVQKVRDSHVVTVSFESADAQLSARIANSLADNYIESNFRQKYDATRQASGWMEQQLDELKAKVEKSQQALVDYERRHAIVNISDKQSVVEQRMSDLSRDLTNAQSDRLQKESVYELVRSNESQVAYVAQNELLQHLQEKYADLKSQYVDALEQSGPKHPKVVRLETQVEEIQSLIAKERSRIVEGLRNDYLAAMGREKLLEGAVANEKVEVGDLNQLPDPAQPPEARIGDEPAALRQPVRAAEGCDGFGGAARHQRAHHRPGEASPAARPPAKADEHFHRTDGRSGARPGCSLSSGKRRRYFHQKH